MGGQAEDDGKNAKDICNGGPLSLFITALDETNSIPIRKQYSKFSIIVTIVVSG